MTENDWAVAARRAPAPPLPLSGELVRTRLIAELTRRFDVPVTTIVAGAGFGKSTLLGQAIRANQVEPRGIDAWVSCEPGDEDALRLARVMTTMLGGSSPRGRGTPADLVLTAFGDLAPLDVCLILDDLHELRPASPAAHLLGELVRNLPPHAHLVLASREPLTVPLSRLRATGTLVEIDAGALAFTAVEMATLADLHGRDVVDVDGLAGWPSLVRLALSAPNLAAPQFLWEEVVGALSPRDQTLLLALATLGCASAEDVVRVAGDEGDLDRLVAKVPLLRVEDDGRFGVHRLWEDAVERLFPADEVRAVRQRALELLRERGDPARGGWLALRWGDEHALRRAAYNLVRTSFGALPVATASRWLSEAPRTARVSPELELLSLALRQSLRFDDPDLDHDIDVLIKRFGVEDRAVPLALGTVIAHGRGDEVRLFTLAQQVEGLPGARREPLLRFLTGAVAAALAGLSGDVERSLSEIDALPFSKVPHAVTELVTRLHAAMLVIAGRAEEAVPVSDRLVGSANGYVRGMPGQVRWAAGDPSPYRLTRPAYEAPADTNLRDELFRAAFNTALYSAFGDRQGVEAMRPVLDRTAAGHLDGRDSAIVTVSNAARLVLAHDEKRAAAALASHLSSFPLSLRVSEVFLRRGPAVAYVCSREVREFWDAHPVGPSHDRCLRLARLLIDARQGSLGSDLVLPEVSAFLTALPLPWSAELLARSRDAGCVTADQRLGELAEWTGAALWHELDWLVTHGDDAVAAGARTLRGLVPDPTRASLRVDVLGPLRLAVDRVAVERAEARRARVRMVIVLLVLAGPIRRERLTELIWPELDPEAAARNLRVTLSRLRHLLEPDRHPGEPCLSLRMDSEWIAIAGRPYIDSDLWQLRDHLDEVEAAQRDGDSERAVAHLEEACALWRGEPCSDVAVLPDIAPAVEEVMRSLVDAMLRLGELRLVAGRFDGALAYAQRAVTAAPYSERARRLVIAAQLQRRDREGLQRALLEVDDMLRDLGVDPEPSTQMLMRQAQARIVEPSAPADV